MTTVHVVGHGALTADRPMTIVPEGGQITFYTDVDFDLVMTNALEVLQTGDALIRLGKFAGVGNGYKVGSGQPVENYSLGPLSDNERVLHATAAKPGLTIMYIGDQLPANIHLCEGDEVMCAEGQHHCGGVFGRLYDADEIVYLACRGVEGQPDKQQQKFGRTSSTEDADRFDQEYYGLMALSEEERGKQLLQLEDLRHPDAQEALAKLMTYDDLRKAAYKERTRQAVASDPRAVAAMFYGQPKEEQEWMSEIPAVLEALRKAKKPSAFGKTKMAAIVESPEEDSIVESPEEDSPSEKPKKPSAFGRPK
jgi:hypothetical protein